MINFDDVTKENIVSSWSSILNIKIGVSGSGKTNSLLNLISQHSYIDKIYLYAKNPYETKNEFLINKQESVGLTQFNNSKDFID